MAAAIPAAGTEVRPPPPAPVLHVNDSGDAVELIATLAQATALAQRAHSTALSLGLERLGQIDLPELTTPATAEDQEQLRAIAPLYLAAQLEEARLLPVVETLSALAVTGGLKADLGRAQDQVAAFWRQRNERFTERERRALFGRLFGADESGDFSRDDSRDAPLNYAFENLMIDLCESLYKLDEQSLGRGAVSPQAHVRVQMSAQSVADNLLNRVGGITAFAAEEILITIQAAVQILQQPPVQRAFGARSLWPLVQTVAQRYLESRPDTATYVTRGKSGLVILSWVADSLPLLSGGGRLLTLDHPVIGAAIEWLHASLTVREAQAGG